MQIIHNFPLMAALISMIAAQVIKVPLNLIWSKNWDVARAFSTGGMPSSHSAAVTSLTAAIGISEGLDSSTFAVAAVLSAITMYDAAGVRRHAGLHASFLNRLVRSTPSLLKDHGSTGTELKELLGHRPIEVLAGAFFGIAASIVIYFTLYA
ncbi:divergent PAP2 family protein [Paenibacillus wynnii]|uniref:divergent PAP2 family protein n=1 Tax=Paenibacillus wynnii TaxID=268407 RepID=UPI00278FD50A|nr:divergent PAP2 family protein [Paenibacillus wynnii]MDQ0195051.1 acid phosphatase family membrane protein YuiD [Paenibacillus wynnii]